MMDLLGRTRARADFNGFVASHEDDLIRTAYLMTSDSAETEELVQECLERVARHWPRVRRMEHPGAYARRILVNLVIAGSKRRSQRSLELTHDEQVLESLPDPESELEDSEEELLEALRGLPPRQRAAIVLRYFGDLSEAQTADAMGCSIGTIKSLCSRGLGRMREMLETRSET